MSLTYYDSSLRDSEIDAALHAIDRLIAPENNGKIIIVRDGKLVADDVTHYSATLVELTVDENGAYLPPAGVDGFSKVLVDVVGGEPVIEPKTITENGIYTVPEGVDGFGPVIVGVAVRSPRCDQVVTFDWAEEQKYIAWMDDVPDVRPGPTPPPTPEPELLADIVTTFDWAEEQKYIAWDDSTPQPRPEPTPPTPVQNVWVNGTDAEVAAVLDAAADGTIDLQQDAGWHVGDMRTIHVNSFVGLSSDDEGAHDGITTEAQDVRIAITSFEEYMGCGNVLQFDFVDCITVGLPIEGTDSTADGYYRTAMWNTLRMALHYALPSWLYTRLKPFSVLVSKGGGNIGTIETVYNNYLALRSAVEIFGDSQQADPGEGVQIPYYATAANRIKTLGIGGSATDWWERSPKSATDYGCVSNSGSNSSAAANARLATAPFGCL